MKRQPGIWKTIGGKAGQVEALTAMLPPFTRYVDPFVGGASLPLYLRATGLAGPLVLSDVSSPVMCVYVAARDHCDTLIDELDPMRTMTGREVFERYRDDLNALYRPQTGLLQTLMQVFTVPDVAARAIYLNRRTFNGLSRVNLSGELNMPWGADAVLPSAETIRAVAQSLQGSDLRCCSFEDTIAATREGDLLFVDPPYLDLAGKDGFTSYAGSFGLRQHRKLEQACRAAGERGVKVLSCNADCAEARVIWRGWNIERVMISRPGNRDKDGRGAVPELRIRNY